MKICLISREYPPETGFGGIATFARNLACGLVELGHEVNVVCLAQDKEKTVEQEGVKVHRVLPYYVPGELGTLSRCIPYSRYVLRTSAALWNKFLELHKERPFDVVDAPELLAESLIPSFCKTAPLVIRLYTPHSKFIAEKLHGVKNSFDHEFVAALERVAMSMADAITSPSDDLADFVAKDLGYPRDQIHIVRNPIDPTEFTPNGEHALTFDGKLVVLFVGRLEERKGINYLVDAIPEVVRSCPSVHFVIIGDDTKNSDGQQPMKKQLVASIEKNGVGANITFIPRVPLADLPKYYRSAAISVVPSLYDNSPYTCLEAMSCGRPVIGTSGGGTAEYVVDKESGLIVPPRDSKALAEAIIKLAGDTELRETLGKNARSRTLEQFARKEIARQTLEVYKLAQKNYESNKENALYLKPQELLLKDAEHFFFTLDNMLYNMLYTHSISFRIRHWWKLLTTRPRLGFAKLFLAIMERILGLSPSKGYLYPKWLKMMAYNIAERQYADNLTDPFAELFQHTDFHQYNFTASGVKTPSMEIAAVTAAEMSPETSKV